MLNRLLLTIFVWLLVANPQLVLADSVAIQNIWFDINGKNTLLIDATDLKINEITESNTNDRLVVKMSGAMPYTWLNEIKYSSDLIVRAELENIQGQGSVLTVYFRKPVAYYARVFNNPSRLEISFTDLEYSKVEHKLTDGVLFNVIDYRTRAGKVRVYLLDVAPDAPYNLKAITDGEIPGRTRLSTFARRTDILAAVNGSYFAPNGEIIGVLKTDNVIVSSDVVPRAVAGFRSDGGIDIEIAEYNGNIVFADKSVRIDYVNRSRYANTLVLYNRAYGERTGTNDYGTEYVVVDGIISEIHRGNSVIPANGVVLSANGTAADALGSLKAGDKVEISQSLGAVIDGCPDAIGAGPQLIRDGRIDVTSSRERILPDIAVGRAPRTALAITADRHILLAVVDGRQKHSIGMTLDELAEFLLKSSAQKAMNLDGGGSSSMLIFGKIINLPSDGRERPVASAVALVRK